MIAYNVYTVVVSKEKIINSKEDITGLLKLLFRVAEMFLVWFEYTYSESCVLEAVTVTVNICYGPAIQFVRLRLEPFISV